MLNKFTTELAVNLAEVITDSKISLSSKPNTLMGELCSAVNNNDLLNVRPVSVDGISGHLEATSTGVVTTNRDGDKEYAGSEHDAIMDNYISEMTVLLSNYLNFSRNTVNSKVFEFKETAEEVVDGYRFKDPEDFFEVEYFKLPEIFNSQVVTDEISDLKGKTNHYNKPSINLEAIKGEQSWDQYFMTGHEGTDTEILSWIKTVDWVSGILLDNVNEFNLSLKNSLEYSLVNYIFYRNLKERLNINTGDSTGILRSKASELACYYGELTAASIGNYKAMVKTGRLLDTSTQTNFSYLSKEVFKVVVFEESFSKAIESGCTIETVFGFLASVESSHSLNVKDLEKNKDKYNSVWTRTRGLYLVYLNNNRLDTFKHLLRTIVDAQLSNDLLTESEKEIIESDPSFNKKTLKLSHEYIDNLQVSEIEDLDTIALELVAKIRFRFSNAYDILKEMDELLKANEDLEPKEAALYSAINYLTDYLLEQTQSVKL